MNATDDDATRSLIARIDRIESHQALRDLVSDYCHGFDKRDWDRFISIWSDDCEWNIGPPFGKFHGLDGIRKAVTEVLWPVWRESHHLTTNLRITFADDNHASGMCDVDCVGALTDDSVQMVGATYYDDFERREGKWQIRRRRVTIHYFNPVPEMQLSAPQAGNDT